MIKFARNLKASRVAAGLALATTAVILAAGCSSSSAPTTTTSASPTTTTTSASSSTTTTSAATTTSTTSAATTTSTTSAGALGSSLLSKFQSGEHTAFIATYKITSGTGSLTSLTIAQQPPDSLFGGSSSSGTFELITLGKKSYICSGQSSGGTGGTCLSEGAAGASEADLFKLYEPGFYLPYFQAAAKAAGGQVSYSSKTVNGISLSCVTVTGVTGEKGTGTFCVTDQGVLGYVSWTGSTASGAGSFEITSYSTTVPANEFTLPATPTTIP